MAYERCKSLQGSPPRNRGKRRKSRHKLHKRGLNTKRPLAVDSNVMPVRAIITQGTTADRPQEIQLIEGLPAENLWADRGCDSNTMIDQAFIQRMNPVIPPKKNRKIQRDYNKDLYKARRLVENAFLQLKRWRGIETRYAKNSSSFFAAIHIKCIAIWADISWIYYLKLFY